MSVTGFSTHFVGIAEDRAGDLAHQVDLEALDVGGRRLPVREQQGVLIHAGDELAVAPDPRHQARGRHGAGARQRARRAQARRRVTGAALARLRGVRQRRRCHRLWRADRGNRGLLRVVGRRPAACQRRQDDSEGADREELSAPSFIGTRSSRLCRPVSASATRHHEQERDADRQPRQCRARVMRGVVKAPLRGGDRRVEAAVEAVEQRCLARLRPHRQRHRRPEVFLVFEPGHVRVLVADARARSPSVPAARRSSRSAQSHRRAVRSAARGGHRPGQNR